MTHMTESVHVGIKTITTNISVVKTCQKETQNIKNTQAKCLEQNHRMCYEHAAARPGYRAHSTEDTAEQKQLSQLRQRDREHRETTPGGWEGGGTKQPCVWVPSSRTEWSGDIFFKR